MPLPSPDHNPAVLLMVRIRRQGFYLGIIVSEPGVTYCLAASCSTVDLPPASRQTLSLQPCALFSMPGPPSGAGQRVSNAYVGALAISTAVHLRKAWMGTRRHQVRLRLLLPAPSSWLESFCPVSFSLLPPLAKRLEEQIWWTGAGAQLRQSSHREAGCSTRCEIALEKDLENSSIAQR